MTYCVGMRLDRGLVFMSDTRTNAGVDNIATARKMHTWEVPGERVITLMTAGNLATTQAVVGLIDERTKATEDRNPTILDAPSMFQIAKDVGETLRGVIRNNVQGGLEASASTFGATMIVGGQIKGGPPRLFLIYPEGNFIEASSDNPFFQIGETKYGKPILV
ncbi:MAG: peptidase, partial [Pseudomonadota bacterium]